MSRMFGMFTWKTDLLPEPWARAARQVAMAGETMVRSAGGRFVARWPAAPAGAVEVGRAGESLCVLGGAARARADRPARNRIAHSIAEGLADGRAAELLADLDGAFSVCGWDAAREAVVLATDPTGRRGLYYTQAAGGVAWASRPWPLARLLGQPQIDREALNLYLDLRGVPAPWSLLKGVRKLHPGHMLEVGPGGCVEREYWPAAAGAAPYDGDLDAASAELLRLLAGALERSAAGGAGELGVFLSGGLDSTALLALARRAGLPARAFTVGYEPAYHGDETAEARQAAERLGAPIEVHYLSPRVAADLAIAELHRGGEPIADSTMLPQIYLARQLAGQAAVVLDGTGADVVLAGTTKYTADPTVRRYQRIPRPLRHGLLEPVGRLLPASRRWTLTNQVRRWQFLVSGADLPFGERAVQWTRFMPHPQVRQLLGPGWGCPDDLGGAYLRALRAGPAHDEISALSLMTLRGHTPWVEGPKLAGIEDASGLRIVTPFLAPEVVEFCLRLPGALKVRGSEGKLPLRRAGAGLIPPATIARRKAVFATPISRWLHGDMAELFCATLLHPTGLFDGERLQRMARADRLGWRDWQGELWAVFALQRWWIAGSAGAEGGVDDPAWL